jgi:hypothetical protein
MLKTKLNFAPHNCPKKQKNNRMDIGMAISFIEMFIDVGISFNTRRHLVAGHLCLGPTLGPRNYAMLPGLHPP